MEGGKGDEVVDWLCTTSFRVIQKHPYATLMLELNAIFMPTTTTYDQLVSYLLWVFAHLDGDQKHWIGLAGAPGSGKSTTAQAMCQRLPEKVTAIPMDGYHYYRRQLDAMD
ncbi:MAG: hypothetical protein AAGE59_37270, partial [Cyanobacteria bacterium P01_F01_bin.86]